LIKKGPELHFDVGFFRKKYKNKIGIRGESHKKSSLEYGRPNAEEIIYFGFLKTSLRGIKKKQVEL
jgi:hypothetical protein